MKGVTNVLEHNKKIFFFSKTAYIHSNMLLICIIDFILQIENNVSIAGHSHLTYSSICTKLSKVGMSDTQKWIEEVLKPNTTFLFLFYDSTRKQFLHEIVNILYSKFQ